MRNKQKIAVRTTLSGAEVHNVALNKNGVPMLGAKMNFLTIKRDGTSLKDKESKCRSL